MFVIVLSTIFFVVGIIVMLNRRGSFNDYKEKWEQEKKKIEQEIEEEDELDFLDDEEKKALNFLFAGLIGTVLFLVTGLFTGNSMYLILSIFIFTAIVYFISVVSKGPFK
ncbi:MAG: hypothetical protein LBE34_15620 [Flavobacteriaceae bacterium]|jgi:hypothetical protein|nr:hypothetical protein [Flavobacteriaceae bacterium]